MRSFASHVTNSATACQSLQVCKNCARSCGSTMRRMLRSRSHSSRGERGVRHRKVEGVARRAGLRYRIGLCKVAFQGLEVELIAPLLLRFRAPMPPDSQHANAPRVCPPGRRLAHWPCVGGVRPPLQLPGGAAPSAIHVWCFFVALIHDLNRLKCIASQVDSAARECSVRDASVGDEQCRTSCRARRPERPSSSRRSRRRSMHLPIVPSPWWSRSRTAAQPGCSSSPRPRRRASPSSSRRSRPAARSPSRTRRWRRARGLSQ